jgi:2-C-methyl-D-erythritol 4-phosphate cytidylyltransferase/2-C-methyl-D-erythritol 2,4-cyclodiphosphate synthase
MSAAVAAPRCWAVIPAAGSSQRMAAAVPKQYLALAGATVIEHALAPFIGSPHIAGIVVVLAAEDRTFGQLACARHPLVSATIGGAERARSVLNGLEALAARAASDDWILVHDAARPCLAQADLERLIRELYDDPLGGLLAVPVGDTLKRSQSHEGRSEGTLERSGVWAAQTPQMFRLQPLREAIEQALRLGLGVTDEAFALEARGLKPRLVRGSARNLKITQADDLALAEAILAPATAGAAMKVGIGFDAHTFGAGDHVMLGGVRIAHTHGLIAHSDGDVIIHALCDALLGAAGLGDIGQHFPDSDPRWRGVASRTFLEHVVRLLDEHALRIVNADVTLLAEEPRLAPHRDMIRRTLAELLRVPAEALNLKATTLERMGFIGRGEGLAAQAIALVAEKGAAPV